MPMTITRNTERRQADIIRAAAALFDQRGFHNVSVGDIATQVGMSKATLYHYVTSKAEIVVWILDSVTNPLLARLEEQVAAGIDPRAGLRMVIGDVLEIMDTRPGYLRVYFEHHREIPDDVGADALAKRDRYEQLVTALVDEGVAQGLFRPLPERLTALALFGMVNWTYQWYRPDSGLTRFELTDLVYDIFLRGIGAEPGRDEPPPAVDLPPVFIEPAPDPMAAAPVRRLSDRAWAVLEPALHGDSSERASGAADPRRSLDAIAFKLQTGASWRSIPPQLGSWRTAYGRLSTWREDGTWSRLRAAADAAPALGDELDWLDAAAIAGDDVDVAR